MNSLFHIAFPIKDLQETREFYVGLLGCTIGRESMNWMDFNFFGHQLTAQVNPDAVCNLTFYQSEKNPFPTYHFGAVLAWGDWHQLEEKLKKANAHFIVEPKTVFVGEVGEQKTMFLQDPNGYAIEFKTFEEESSLFRK